MSLLASVNSSDDPYAGGGLFRSSPPANGPTGSIGGFTSSGQPPNVTPSQQRKARNDRGSNITIPYARICPVVGDKMKTTTAAGDGGGGYQDRSTVFPVLAPLPGSGFAAPTEHMQYEGLGAGDVVFVRRMREGSAPVNQHLMLSTVGGVGAGVDRMQKLCSVPWLKYVTMLRFSTDAQLVANFPRFSVAPAASLRARILNAAGAMAAEYAVNRPIMPIYGGILSRVNNAEIEFTTGFAGDDNRGVYQTLQQRIEVGAYPAIRGNQAAAAQLQLLNPRPANWVGVGSYARSTVEDYYDSAIGFHQLVFPSVCFSNNARTLLHAYTAAAAGGAKQAACLAFIEAIALDLQANHDAAGGEPSTPFNVGLTDGAVAALANNERLYYDMDVPVGIGAFPPVATMLVDPIAIAAFQHDPVFCGGSIGNVVDAELEKRLDQLGLFDWVPDGIVINKVDGGHSPFVEGYINSTMGQMFNVAVQGPAVCKTFKLSGHNMMHKTNPRDEMFVAVTAKMSCYIKIPTIQHAFNEAAFDLCYTIFNADFAKTKCYAHGGNGPSYVEHIRKTLVTNPAASNVAHQNVESRCFDTTLLLPSEFNNVPNAKSDLKVHVERSPTASANAGDRLFARDGTPGATFDLNGGLVELVDLLNPSLDAGSGANESVWPRLVAFVQLPHLVAARLGLRQTGTVSPYGKFSFIDAATGLKTEVDHDGRNLPEGSESYTQFLTFLEKLSKETARGFVIDIQEGRSAFARRYHEVVRLVDIFEKMLLKYTGNRVKWDYNTDGTNRNGLGQLGKGLNYGRWRFKNSAGVTTEVGAAATGVADGAHNAIGNAVQVGFPNIGNITPNNADIDAALGNAVDAGDMAYIVGMMVSHAQPDITDKRRRAQELSKALLHACVVAGLVKPVHASVGEFEMELVGAQQLSTGNVYRTKPSTDGMGVMDRRPEAVQKYGYAEGGTNSLSQAQGRCIVGAWKVGTVLDSAASPLAETVTTSYSMNSAINPSNSFADNLNVNVEWWTGAQLRTRFAGRPKPRTAIPKM